MGRTGRRAAKGTRALGFLLLCTGPGYVLSSDPPSCPTGAICGKTSFKDRSYACDSTTTPLKPGQADIVEFRCLDGRCISVEGLSNGIQNCEDGSDEPAAKAPAPAAASTTKSVASTTAAPSKPAPPKAEPKPEVATTTPAPTSTTKESKKKEEQEEQKASKATTTEAKKAPQQEEEPTPAAPPAPTEEPQEEQPDQLSDADEQESTPTSAPAAAPKKEAIVLPDGPEIQRLSMEDNGEDVLYLGPIDFDSKAHGTGKMEYADGSLFFGLFNHGEMLTGVYYGSADKAPREAMATMLNGEWTEAMNPLIAKSFPLAETFEGPLKVLIKSAEGLKNSDWLDSSDAFVEVQLTGSETNFYKTNTIENSVNPEWDYSVDLPIVKSGDGMTLKVRDKDSWEGDDHLGHTQLEFTSIPVTKQLQLENHRGSVSVSITSAYNSKLRATVGAQCKQFVVLDMSKKTDLGLAGTLKSGLQYCLSPELEDKDQAEDAYAPYGSVVNAYEVEPGWVQLAEEGSDGKPRFLPIYDGGASGRPMLLPYKAKVRSPGAGVTPSAQTIQGPKEYKAATTTIVVTTTTVATTTTLPKTTTTAEVKVKVETTTTVGATVAPTTAAAVVTTTEAAPAVIPEFDIPTIPEEKSDDGDKDSKPGSEGLSDEEFKQLQEQMLGALGDDEEDEGLLDEDYPSSPSGKPEAPELPTLPPMAELPTLAPLATTEAPIDEEQHGTPIQDLPIKNNDEPEAASDEEEVEEEEEFSPEAEEYFGEPGPTESPEASLQGVEELKEEYDEAEQEGPSASELLKPGDKVVVMATVQGVRSCDLKTESATAMTQQSIAKTCPYAGEKVEPGNSGVVLANGPEDSAIIMWQGEMLPQLILESQFKALVVEHDDYCSQGAVVVEQTFKGSLGEDVPSGDYGAIGEAYPDRVNITFPRMRNPQVIEAKDFQKLGCSDSKRKCKGTAVVVLKDFAVAGTEVQLAAGQWLQIEGISGIGDLTVLDGDESYDIPKEDVRNLGCLASEVPKKARGMDLFAEFYAPPTWIRKFEDEHPEPGYDDPEVSKKLIQDGLWSGKKEEDVENDALQGVSGGSEGLLGGPLFGQLSMQRRLDDEKKDGDVPIEVDISNILTDAVVTASTPNWLDDSTIKPAPDSTAAILSAIGRDGCEPEDDVEGDLEVVFSMAVTNMEDNPDIATIVAGALSNITGPADVNVEVRSGSPSILLGRLSLEEGGVPAKEACYDLRKKATVVVQDALRQGLPVPQLKNTKSSKAPPLTVVGGQYSVQSTQPKRYASAANKETSYKFNAIMSNFQQSAEDDSTTLKEKLIQGVYLALGKDLSAEVKPRGGAGVQVKTGSNYVLATYLIPAASVEEAMLMATSIGACGPAYMQAILRPVMGATTKVQVQLGTISYPRSVPSAEIFEATTEEEGALSESAMTYLEFAGLRPLTAVAPKSTKTASQSRPSALAAPKPKPILRSALLMPPTGKPSKPPAKCGCNCEGEQICNFQTEDYPFIPPPCPPAVHPPTDVGLPPLSPLPDDLAVERPQRHPHRWESPVPPPLPPLPPWPLCRSNERDLPQEDSSSSSDDDASALSLLVTDDFAREPIDIFNLSATLECSCKDVTYEPLDMPGQGPTKEVTIAACQSRCAQTRGCATWAYWLTGGICHLQNAFAYRTTARFGFISGPAGCRPNQESLLLLEIQLKKLSCFEMDTSYVRLDMAGTGPVRVDTVIDCQDRCARNLGCTNFTFNSLSGICHITDEQASAVPNMQYYVSGPPVCEDPVTFNFTIKDLCYDCLVENNAIMFKLELAIRNAVAAQTLYQLCIDNVAIIIRPYVPDYLGFLEEEQKNTLVQVLVWPPTGMTTDEVQFYLNQTASLTRKLNRAVNSVKCLKKCRKKHECSVCDVTDTVVVPDVTGCTHNKTKHHHKKKHHNGLIAHLFGGLMQEKHGDNYGYDAAQLGREHEQDEDIWGAKEHKRSVQGSTLQRDEVSPNSFWRPGALLPPYSSSTFFVFGLLACAFASFAGVSGGMMLMRTVATHRRQQRVQAATNWAREESHALIAAKDYEGLRCQPPRPDPDAPVVDHEDERSFLLSSNDPHGEVSVPPSSSSSSSAGRAPQAPPGLFGSFDCSPESDAGRAREVRNTAMRMNSVFLASDELETVLE